MSKVVKPLLKRLDLFPGAFNNQLHMFGVRRVYFIKCESMSQFINKHLLIIGVCNGKPLGGNQLFQD